MSNPGVLTLAQHKLKHSKLQVRIEDNLGEAIHYHFGDIRIDLHCSELDKMADDLIDSINNLLEFPDFDIRQLDPIFFSMIASSMPDLIDIRKEEIYLEHLKVVSKGFCGIPIVKPLRKSRVSKALMGDTREQMHYKQENLSGQNNMDRLNMIKDSLHNNPYPANGEYIILFNDQNYIKDGQHRASCLLKEHGNIKIEVLRFIFKNNINNVPKIPWLHYLFSWDKDRLRNTLRGLKKQIKFYKHKSIRIVRILISRIQLKLN